MKKRVLVPAIALGLFASTANAGQRDDVAKRWAPVFEQEVRDGKDLLTAFDFDGNWAGDDNEENLSACLDGKKTCDLSAKVYFTVIETSTHWFVQYVPYHATDGKTTNGHEHDTESVFAVVAKDGSATGKLLAIETRFHTEWFAYADQSIVKDGAKSIDGDIHADATGHPQVYFQQVGHGICGGFSPPNDFFPDLQLTCNHGETAHIEHTGVVYRPDATVAAPTITKNSTATVGYAFEEIFTSLWAHRTEAGPGKTYKSLVDFTGERCNTLACPKQYGGPFMGNRGESPSGPWNQEAGAGTSGNGSQFFDPAFTMSKRLTFPSGFSLDYCHNPYLGVVDQCAKPQSVDPNGGDPTKPGGSQTKPSDPSGSPNEGESTGAITADADAGESGCATTNARHSNPISALLIVVSIGICKLRRRRAVLNARA